MHGLYAGRVLRRQRSQCTRSITSKSRECLQIGLEGTCVRVQSTETNVFALECQHPRYCQIQQLSRSQEAVLRRGLQKTSLR
jgi:hypothetical protein